MNRRAIILISVIMCVLILACVGVGIGYAVWTQSKDADIAVNLPDNQTNASLKYMHFSGLNALGEFATENITSYAVVGYTGLYETLQIPSTYAGKPVTAVLADPSKADVSFKNNNKIIQIIIIPTSVMRIGDGVFAQQTQLRRVVVLGDTQTDALACGDYAFSGSHQLSEIRSERQISYGTNALLGCNLG